MHLDHVPADASPVTVSQSGLIRLYGPLEPWFDHTWKPGDIEPV